VLREEYTDTHTTFNEEGDKPFIVSLHESSFFYMLTLLTEIMILLFVPTYTVKQK
jgi:hypothetical protein